jgi:hypothetical protein
MKTIEQRMKAVEEMIAEIHACVVLGKEPAPPDAEKWRRAYDAFLEGDKVPLSLCLKLSGGKVPKAETIYPDAAVQRSGSNARRRRSTNLPTAATTPEGVNNRSEPASLLRSPASRIHPLPDPVMLPGKEQRRVA